MAFTAYLHILNKRRNSTKQPSTVGVAVDILYKDGSDLHHPKLRFYRHSGNAGNLSYNYCEIEGNYYYITNAVYPNKDMCEVNLELDTLATYKSQILDSEQFVEYSASQVNVNISDTRFVTSNTLRVKNATVKMPFTQSGFQGGQLFILNVAGRLDTPSPYSGMVATYVMTSANLFQLNKALMETDWNDEANSELMKMFQSPYNSIISCRRAGNVEIGSALGGSATVYLGYWNSGISASEITTRMLSEMTEVSIPWQYADWRNGAGYTTIQLSLPGFGLVEISTADCYKINHLEVYSLLDVVTGDMTYKIKTPDTVIDNVVIEGTILSICNCNLYSEVPVAQLTQSRNQAIGNAGVQILDSVKSTTAPSMFLRTLLPGGSLITSAQNTIAQYNSSSGGIGDMQLGSITTKGSIGNIGSLQILGDLEIRTIAKVPDNYEQFNKIMGRPLMQVRKLSTLSGYVQCRNASVYLDTYNNINECAEISNFLNGGVYIE